MNHLLNPNNRCKVTMNQLNSEQKIIYNIINKLEGDVEVTGTLTQGGGTLKIDHPLDPAGKYLNHSYMQRPDMKSVYDGVAALDGQGEAWVELPGWFDALNRDFRYQLTAIGAPGPNLYIAEKISGNHFRVAGGTPGMEVSWQVSGIRKDPYAENNRLPVEEEKMLEALGRYLHPKAYGFPETMSIHYEEINREKEQTNPALAKPRIPDVSQEK